MVVKTTRRNCEELSKLTWTHDFFIDIFKESFSTKFESYSERQNGLTLTFKITQDYLNEYIAKILQRKAKNHPNVPC